MAFQSVNALFHTRFGSSTNADHPGHRDKILIEDSLKALKDFEEKNPSGFEGIISRWKTKFNNWRQTAITGSVAVEWAQTRAQKKNDCATQSCFNAITFIGNTDSVADFPVEEKWEIDLNSDQLLKMVDTYTESSLTLAGLIWLF